MIGIIWQNQQLQRELFQLIMKETQLREELKKKDEELCNKDAVIGWLKEELKNAGEGNSAPMQSGGEGDSAPMQSGGNDMVGDLEHHFQSLSTNSSSQ